MTVELSFGKVMQTLIVAGITAIVIYLWNIDSRVKVLEKQQSVVERVERLETAMLPVLATWKAEELFRKEMEGREEEREQPMGPFPLPFISGSEPPEDEDADEPDHIKERKARERHQRTADEWAREQLRQRTMD